jgi:hypothetical protein
VEEEEDNAPDEAVEEETADDEVCSALGHA